MKKILFAVLLTVSTHTQIALAITTPKGVTNFYSSLNALQQATTLNAANDAQQRMASCFMASDQSGINLSMDGLGEMSSNLYTMRLHSLIFNERRLKTQSTINRTDIIEQPDQNSNMQRTGAQHYVSYITKKYIKDGQETIYNDVVFTLIKNGLIVEMENSLAPGITPPPARSDQKLSIEQLRARAAYYYSKKDFDIAYSYYERLIKAAPRDGDAAYRIALLTFWRKGCKHRFSKKEAKNRALNYIDKAIQYGNYDIRNKATNVKANWQNDNVYF